MTVININNISGIASVNAQSNSLELFDNTGASLLDLNANTATFPGGISVGGTVTYDDVTNIDSVGVITARSGVHVTSGSVGIGTDNPTKSLSILSSQSVMMLLEGTTSTSRIGFKVPTTTNNPTIGAISGNDLQIRTGGEERFRIMGDGKVGIGTDDPTELVTVGSAVTTALFEIKPQLSAIDINVSSGDFSPHYQDNFVIYNGQPDSGTERFRITQEGIITKPYQVAFFVYGSNGDTDLTAGTKFQFDSIATNSKVALNTNHTTYNGTNVYDTTNYRFTAPVAGLYHFTVAVYFRRTGDPQTAIVPYVNNSVVQSGNDVFFFSNQDIQDGQTLSGSLILQLAANDYVSVHRRSSSQSGTTRCYGPHSHFCGYLIG